MTQKGADNYVTSLTYFSGLIAKSAAINILKWL